MRELRTKNHFVFVYLFFFWGGGGVFLFVKFLCWAQSMKSPRCLYCIFSYFLRVNFGLKGLFLNIQVLLNNNETCHHQQEVYEDVFSPSLTCSWDSGNGVLNHFTPRSAQNKHWNKFHFKEILKLKTSCITGKYYSVAFI